jgi:uncharacterized protein (TIGR02246 family)
MRCPLDPLKLPCMNRLEPLRYALVRIIGIISPARTSTRFSHLNGGALLPRYPDDLIVGRKYVPSSLKAISAGFALGIVLLSIATVASAGPTEDVAAAASTWAGALGEDDPDKVLPLYSDDAVFWGTLSPKVRADRAAMRDYFVTAFRVLPGLKVTFGDQLIRVYGDMAVNTGCYTFSYVKDGETRSLPARYSFTYVKRGGNWLIVDHHSSTMPYPPK